MQCKYDFYKLISNTCNLNVTNICASLFLTQTVCF